MAHYLSVKVEGHTLEVGQNVQMFVGMLHKPQLEYLADFRITAVSPKTGYAVVNCTAFSYGNDSGRRTMAEFVNNPYGRTHVRFQVQTASGVAYEDLKIDALFPELYVHTSESGALGYGLKLTKKAPWGLKDRASAYFELVTFVYRHLRGLLESDAASLALRAEASLLVSMLMVSEDLKNHEAASLRTDRAKRIADSLSHLSEPMRRPRLSPLDIFQAKGALSKSTYTKYIGQVRQEVSELASWLYANFFKGTLPKPQTIMIGVGDGSDTRGVLGKGNEGCGLFAYDYDDQSRYTATLEAVGEGHQSVVHFFVTGINSDTAKAKVTLQGGGRRYSFDVMKERDSGRFTPSTGQGATVVTRRAPDGSEFRVHVFPDGSFFDGSVRDFTFSPDTFSEPGPIVVSIESDKDEKLIGLAVVPSYAPLAMLGLYETDKQVPWKQNDPGLPDAAARAQVNAAHALVEACARLCAKFDRFEITMTPGGIGQQVSANEIASAPATVIDDLRALDPAAKQQLRASFIQPRVHGTKLVLDIRSYTDADYAPRSQTVTYNKALSARRCWGILGLLVQKVAALDHERAKALWTAAPADTSPLAKAAYLASPGALNPGAL